MIEPINQQGFSNVNGTRMSDKFVSEEGDIVWQGFADVNGTRMYYKVAGQGHPLTLIHGGLVDRRLWDDQFNAFAQHFKVICYDIRRFRFSEFYTFSFF